MASFEITWQAREYDYPEKSVSWYWISIIISVLILGLAVWQKNFLFGFFIVVAEVLILSWANRTPPLIDFKLDEKGLLIGTEKQHAYSEFEAWSVENDEDS